MSRLRPVVVDGLDVVAVGVQDVGRVVARVIARALPGRAVIGVAGGCQLGVKTLDAGIVGRERHVDVLRGLALEQGEGRAVGAVQRRAAGVLADREAQGLGEDAVEGGRRRQVRDADPEVVDDPRPLRHVAVVHGLDAVAVGAAQERAVIVGQVLDPRPGRSVVEIATVDAGPPERVDVVVRRSSEPDVQTGRERVLVVGVREREVVPLGELVGPVARLDPQLDQDGVEEARGRLAVGDVDRDVVEHRPVSLRPVLAFASDADWEAWLDEHHATSDGVWIKIAKKGSGIPSVAYPEVLDTALCFGWIDGQRKALDETYFLQRFTPRRARSKWSKINRDKVEALTKAGRMRPRGLA